MSKVKVSKSTGLIVDKEIKKDPLDGSDQFVDKYKGRALIFDPSSSEIAQRMGVKTKGNYAIKY